MLENDEIRLPRHFATPQMGIAMRLARRVLTKSPVAIKKLPEAQKLRYVMGLVCPTSAEMSLEANPIFVQCALSQLYLSYLPDPLVIKAFLAPMCEWREKNAACLVEDKKLWETETNDQKIQDQRLGKICQYLKEWCALYGCLAPDIVRPFYQHEKITAQLQYRPAFHDGRLIKQTIRFDPTYIASRSAEANTGKSNVQKIRRKDLPASRVEPGKAHAHTIVLAQFFHEFIHLWQCQLAVGSAQHQLPDTCLEDFGATAPQIRRERLWFASQWAKDQDYYLPDYVQNTFRYETDPLEIFALSVEAHADYPFPIASLPPPAPAI